MRVNPRFALVVLVGVMLVLGTSSAAASAQDLNAQQTYQGMKANYDTCVQNSEGGGWVGNSLNGMQSIGFGVGQAAAGIALTIFKWLFMIELVWWLLDNLRKTSGGTNLVDLLGGIGFKMIAGFFFMGLIVYLGGIGQTSSPIMHALTAFGNYAIQIMQPAVAAGVAPFPKEALNNINLGPDALMRIGWCGSVFVLDSGTLGLQSGGNIFTTIANAMSTMPATLVNLFSAFVLLIAFVILGAQLYIALLESGMVATAGLFVLGFTGSRWTMAYGQAVFKYIFAVGMKIFTIFIIGGFAIMIVNASIQNTVDAMMLAAQNNGGFVGGQEMKDALSLVAIAVLLIMLAVTVPKMAATFITGTPEMTLGEAIGVAAGTAAFAAAGATVARGGMTRVMGALGGGRGGGSITSAGSVPRAAAQSSSQGSSATRNGSGQRGGQTPAAAPQTPQDRAKALLGAARDTTADAGVATHKFVSDLPHSKSHAGAPGIEFDHQRGL